MIVYTITINFLKQWHFASLVADVDILPSVVVLAVHGSPYVIQPPNNGMNLLYLHLFFFDVLE